VGIAATPPAASSLAHRASATADAVRSPKDGAPCGVHCPAIGVGQGTPQHAKRSVAGRTPAERRRCGHAGGLFVQDRLRRIESDAGTSPECRSLSFTVRPGTPVSARLREPIRKLAVLPPAQGQTALSTMPISNAEILVSGDDVVGVAVVSRPADSGGLKLCATWAGGALTRQIVHSAPKRGRLLEQARRRTP